MNSAQVYKILLVVSGFAFVTLRADGQTSDAMSPSPLSPLAFLTTHEWDAALPDSAGGKKTKIHARFAWAQNRRAIRISNQFVTNGEPKPYIDGLYAWDPQQHVIVFWYVGADGSLTKGTVKVEGGKLVHEFEEIGADGKSATFTARVTQQGDQAWENEIFARKENVLTPLVKVRYEIAH